MITLKNKQKKIAVDTQRIKKIVTTVLQVLRYEDFDIGILLTTNRRIKQYNKLYRNQDKPTDILSFSWHPLLKAGQRIVAKSQDDKNLGDLILSVEYISKAAATLNVSLDERIEVLVIHGMCHLLGYDHILDADYKKMHRKELFLLKKVQEALKD